MYWWPIICVATDGWTVARAAALPATWADGWPGPPLWLVAAAVVASAGYKGAGDRLPHHAPYHIVQRLVARRWLRCGRLAPACRPARCGGGNGPAARAGATRRCIPARPALRRQHA